MGEFFSTPMFEIEAVAVGQETTVAWRGIDG
jgi:hypothetical protein